MSLQRIMVLLVLMLSMMSSYALAGNAKIYTQTSYYVAYDAQDTTQYMLVMPDVQKIYTHKAGDVTHLNPIADDFQSFPSYNNGKLCFSALKSGILRAFDASKIAGKCYDVKFYYTQKEVVGDQTAFMLYYAPKAKLYEGLAGNASSFKVVRKGNDVFNAQSVTDEDYTEFVFDKAAASITIGKDDVVVNATMQGVVNPLNGATLKVYGLDGVELFSTTTDANGSYSLQVDKNKLNRGFILEATKGSLNGEDFNGTLRAIYSGTHALDKANVTLITTLVSTLATAQNRSARDNTLLDKRDVELQKLEDMGMVKKADWFEVEPSLVNVDELVGTVGAEGLDAWLTDMNSDLADTQLGRDKMGVFGMAHGGILRAYAKNRVFVFPGETIQVAVGAETDENATDENVTLSFEGNVPDWVGIDKNILTISPYETEEPLQTKTVSLNITKNGVKEGRKKSLDILLMKKVVLLEGDLGVEGGTLFNEWKDISVRFNSNVLEQEHTFKLVTGQNFLGITRIKLESLPELSDGEKTGINISLPPSKILRSNYLNINEGIVQNRSELLDRQTSNLGNLEKNFCVNKETTEMRGFIFNNIWQGTVDRYESNLFTGSWNGGEPLMINGEGDRECSSRLWALNDISNASLLGTDREPVLLVHGFIKSGELGSIDDSVYFGNFAKVLNSTNKYVPFEFDWRTNASFSDMAVYLRRAVRLISQKTGKQVHIMAHSFGGLLVRSAIQIGYKSKEFSEKYISTLTTVGTPHSGISDNPIAISDGFSAKIDNQDRTFNFASGAIINFPRGQHGLGGLIDGCRAITCYQAGDNVSFLNNTDAFNKYGVLQKSGSIIYRLAGMMDDYPNVPTQALIGIRGGFPIPVNAYDSGLSSADQFRIRYTFYLNNGDNLISVAGQRFSPLTYAKENIKEHVLNFYLTQHDEFKNNGIGIYDKLLDVFSGERNTGVNISEGAYDYSISDVVTPTNASAGKYFHLIDNHRLKYTLDNLGNKRLDNYHLYDPFVLGFSHTTTGYEEIGATVNNIFSTPIAGLPILSEVGIQDCDSAYTCNNPTWLYFKTFAEAHPATEIDPPSEIVAKGTVEYRGAVNTQLANASINRDVTPAVPFPVTVEAYTGSALSAFMNPLARTTLNDDGTYELNVTYSPDTNYTVIAYPEGDTFARIGAFVRASASKLLTTFSTLEESILQFPTITLTDGNYEEGNLTIVVVDQLGRTVNGFDAEILNRTLVSVDDNSNNINSGYQTTQPKGSYSVEVSKEGYHNGENPNCTVNANTNVECKVYVVSKDTLVEGQIKIILGWGTSPSDLDSHLVRKTNGNQDYHVYYSNMTGIDATLDIDDVDGVGPETVTINNIDSNSTYTYYVHRYSNSGNTLENSGAQVGITFNGNNIPFNVPAGEGRYWKVFEIENGRIIPCQTDCILGSESDIVRGLDRDDYLFENLPAKN